MLNHLQAASRPLARASLALFTAVVLLLIQSAFWSSRVSAWMQMVILATALLAYFRPRYGLLALAVLAPFGRIGSGTLDSQMRGAEALVLAFLAGVLVRGWTLREFRTFPSTRLETTALLFGFVVAASCAEQVWFLQVQRDFPWVFAGELVTYASRNYLTSFRGFGMIFNAMLLLEGLALLCLTVRFARFDPGFGRKAIVAIASGSAGVVLLTFWYVLKEYLDAPARQVSFLEFLTLERWSVHISDVNAAGSFFAMSMFIAFGLALRERRYSLLWTAGGALLGIALLMTYSRTALVAVALVIALAAAAATLGRAIGTGRALAVAAGVSTCLMIGAWRLLPPEYFGAGAVTAVTVRRLFLQVTWRMLRDYPLFGVGIGQFALWSHHYAAPEMAEYYRSENAHNNFAQLAGELGWIGLAAFLLVLTAALWSRTRSKPPRSDTLILLGLAAFVLTWLGGHPLLVPEVAFPFWMALGAVAAGARAPTPGPSRVMTGLSVAAAAVLAITIPFRVHNKAEGVDFTRVRYGFNAGRLVSSEARFFVPAGQTHLEFPLRARAASEDRPILVDLLVDTAVTGTVTLTDRSWQTARLDLPPDGSGKFHQIDLRVRRPEDDDAPVDTRRDSVEVGKWEIISKPNG